MFLVLNSNSQLGFRQYQNSNILEVGQTIIHRKMDEYPLRLGPPQGSVRSHIIRPISNHFQLQLKY